MILPFSLSNTYFNFFFYHFHAFYYFSCFFEAKYLLLCSIFVKNNFFFEFRIKIFILFADGSIKVSQPVFRGSLVFRGMSSGVSRTLSCKNYIKKNVQEKKIVVFNTQFKNIFLACLKWNECNFEIFSNIKLKIFKNTSRCLLYGTTNEKKIYLDWFARKKNRKVGDGDRCNIASYEKKTKTIYSNFFEPKFFKLSVYNLLIEF
jgi:hypothetical protein